MNNMDNVVQQVSTSARVSSDTLRRLREWQIRLATRMNDIPSHDRVISVALDALDQQNIETPVPSQKRTGHRAN